MRNLSVSAIVLYVRDLARSADFYEHVLGLSVRRGQGKEAAEHHTFLVADAGAVQLIIFQGDHPPGRTPIIVFGLSGGIGEIVEDLAAKGVEIVLPVSEAPGGLTADFLDPDGHMLSFYQSTTEAE